MLRKILIVEDSVLVQRMYDLHLMRYPGAARVRAANGAEALTALHENPDVDLILLDINMPVMSGLEFLMRMKREPAFTGVPVVVVTTEGGAMDAERCLGMGAAGYVKKPFTAVELYAAIERAIGPQPRADTP